MFTESCFLVNFVTITGCCEFFPSVKNITFNSHEKDRIPTIYKRVAWAQVAEKIDISSQSWGSLEIPSHVFLVLEPFIRSKIIFALMNLITQSTVPKEKTAQFLGSTMMLGCTVNIDPIPKPEQSGCRILL